MTGEYPVLFVIDGHVVGTAAAHSDLRWRFTVTGRTSRYVTLRDEEGKSHRTAIRIDPAGNEWALPFGRAALSPIARPIRSAHDEIRP